MSVIVAIDGPAGAGKSTVARMVADRTGLTLVDTGAVYRALALFSHDESVDELDEDGLAALCPRMPLRFEMDEGVNRVFLGTREVSEAIRTPDMSMRSSTVSKHPKVRAALLELQRALGRQGEGSVLEGRDIGTVVFPDAQVKIFLTASADERARRRTAELVERGNPQPFHEVLAELEARDKQDSEREVAPLKPADDAELLDSTKFSIDEVVNKIVDLVERRVDGVR